MNNTALSTPIRSLAEIATKRRQEAEAADRAYDAALYATYGLAGGEYRYRYDDADTPQHIRNARAAYQTASDAWHAAEIAARTQE